MGIFCKKAGFNDLGLKGDCHCHLLPGVDDGARSMDDAVAALSAMVEAGIESVVLTPHFHPGINSEISEAMLQKRYQEFLKELPENLKEKMKFSLGAEYMVVDDFEKRDMKSLLQFEEGKVLIEMSYLFGSLNMEETIFAIRSEGLQPVIAHPERYLYLSDKLERLERYHDMGAAFQLDLLSLPGSYGRESVKIMEWLFKKGWYTYFGTDAHNQAHFVAIRDMHFKTRYLKFITI